ncbi:uncharacterized protein LOC128390592 [Panonychus citri]|uniref:uncharacterized protein LOC128390592 n=1 Tax=Panonychus citri TaxID=50023 RepID=UPI0023071650|nr:uncharacterized protein LOC128390592 [Panonychus citri]
MLSQTIRGILEVSDILYSKGFRQVTTRRFNQDIIENHFAQIRHLHHNEITTTKYRRVFKDSMILFGQSLPSSNCEADEDTPLLTESDIPETDSSHQELTELFTSLNPSYPSAISDFLTTFTAEEDIGEDHDCLANHDITNISSNRGLIAYIAGYLIRRIKSKGNHCDLCLPSIDSVNILPDHQFILCRNYAQGDNNFLMLPSLQFINCIISCCEALVSSVPPIISEEGIKFKLHAILRSQDFSFVPSCHYSEIKAASIRHLINMFIGKFMKDHRRHHLTSRKTRKSIKEIQCIQSTSSTQH